MKRTNRSKPPQLRPAASPSGNEPDAGDGSVFPSISSLGQGGALLLAMVLIALAALAVYANTFSSPLVFDDVQWVEHETGIRHPWPPWSPLIDTNRPLADLSFAVNYALDGFNTWGYHVANILIHIAAALALFGVIRRSLSSGRLAAHCAGSAWGIALAVALLWELHPLQTESVTYIYQRYESLMGLFLLLTLYGFIRAQDSPHPKQWYVASVASCLLAVTCKEVAAVAPLVVLWYDRALAASSWREIARRRWAYYAGLACAWPIVAVLLFSQSHKFADAGVLVVKEIAPWQYAMSQPAVIAHYLRLCFWPTGLCLDYRWPPVVAPADAIGAPLLLIAALLAMTVWAILRWPAWSFVGAWFFLILAPTSSVLPLRDLAFEHRMYLPLAAVIFAVVMGVWHVGRWFLRRGAISLPTLQSAGGILTVCVCAALGILTFQRNLLYQSRVSIWEDAVAHVPGNARGHFALARALAAANRFDTAIVEYEKTLELSPDYPDGENDLGWALACCQRFEEAIVRFRAAVARKPTRGEPYYNLGFALAHRGRVDEAIEQYNQALAIRPNYADASNNLGLALAASGRTDEAIACYRKALEFNPDVSNLHNNFASVLARCGKADEALVHFRRAVELNPDYAAAQNGLGAALADRGQFKEAAAAFRKALEIKPDYAEARKNLAVAVGQLKQSE